MRLEFLPHTTFPAGVTRPSSLTLTCQSKNKVFQHEIDFLMAIKVLLWINLNKENGSRKVKTGEMATSMIVPLVTTPSEVYIGPFGFFFIPMISRLKVHFSSGWVTWALVNRRPVGRMKRSYFGGFLVNPGPTKVTFVTILFHCLAVEETISTIRSLQNKQIIGWSGLLGYDICILQNIKCFQIPMSQSAL